MNNNEPYLPSLITESDSQYATRSTRSWKLQLFEHNRSADEKFSIMLQPNYGIIYIS